MQELEDAISKIREDLEENRKNSDVERRMLRNDMYEKISKSELQEIQQQIELRNASLSSQLGDGVTDRDALRKKIYGLDRKVSSAGIPCNCVLCLE